MKPLDAHIRPILLMAAMLACTASCRKQPTDPEAAEPNALSTSTPAPPDLTQCTRIEVRVEPSPLEALRPPAPNEPNVLSTEELRYIASLETMVMDDPQYIQALAERIASYSFEKPEARGVDSAPVHHVSGWRGEVQLTSFQVLGSALITEDNQLFTRDHGREHPVSLTPQLAPFRQRQACALKLWALGRALDRHRHASQAYLAVPQWCDFLVGKGLQARDFTCPGADEGDCHYAMNVNGGPDSPKGTVLLFETKAGWNQHGGPEFFTFDNHEPTGGCVLLNDGTVQFIRTRDELQTLRWK